MGTLIAILFFGGLFALAAIQAILEKRRRRIQDEVAREVLKDFDLEKSVEQYKAKLDYIGHANHDVPRILLERVQSNKKEREEKLFGDCELCHEGYLQLRESRSGKVLMCSNYPRCRNFKKYSFVKSGYKQTIENRFMEDLRQAYS